jgi:hypothetical protein
MAKGDTINGATNGAMHGAAESADDGAAAAPEARIKRPGIGSPGGMYGGHVGSGEILDILEDLRSNHPDARLHLDVIGADGVKRSANTYSPTSFDVEQVARQFGPGEYRVRCQVSGEPRPVKMFRFIPASIAPAAPQTPPPPPPAPAPPQYPPQPFPPQYGPPQGYYAPPPQQAAPQLDLMALVVSNMQQQAQMVNMLLGRLIEQRTTPQEPAKIGELDALLKLADRMGRRRNAEEDDDGTGGLVSQVIAGLAASLNRPAAPAQAPAPRPAIPRATPKHAGGAVVSQPAAVAPPPPALPDTTPPAITPPPAAGGGGSAADQATAPASGAAGADAADLSSLPPGMALIVQSVRDDAGARRLAKLILVDDGDDIQAVAEMALAALSDQQCDQLESADPDGWAGVFVTAFPQLNSRAEFVRAVVVAMQAELENDPDPDNQDPTK